MNATRETVEPAMRAAAEDVGGEYMEVILPDTRNLMWFYVSLRQLMVEVWHPEASCSMHSLMVCSAASQTFHFLTSSNRPILA